MEAPGLFALHGLPRALVANLALANPWWEGKPAARTPATRRHLVERIRRAMERGLAPIVAVRGPRQVGKTTAVRQVVGDELAAGRPPQHILAVQFDQLPSLKRLGGGEPILALVRWYEQAVLGRTLNEAAHAGMPALLVFDEVQNLKDWAIQLKFLVDHATVGVLITGSSALRIELGRDSLAGRITTIEAGPLSLTEIAHFRGIPLGAPALGGNGAAPLGEPDFWRRLRERGRDEATHRDAAFAAFAAAGGYPVAHERPDVPRGLLADQLRETVVKRVIQHDLRVGERGRKRDEALLEGIFRQACRYAGQAPGSLALARELQQMKGGNVGSVRIQRYLSFLAETLLIRLIEPAEIRLKRRRGAAKICLADHMLRESWLQERVELDPARMDPADGGDPLRGHLAESVVGSTFAGMRGLDVNWVPATGREPEVDFVLTVGDHRIPVEVKYQRRVDPRDDTPGLRAFLGRPVNRAPFGLLVTQRDDEVEDDPRIHRVPLASLLLLT